MPKNNEYSKNIEKRTRNNGGSEESYKRITDKVWVDYEG